jgi:hypothetical protein
MPLTPKQKLMRLEAYGASEVPTICGKGGGKLPELWESKVHPRDDPKEEMLLADLGTLLEEPVAAIYAKRTQTHLAVVDTIVHPERPLAICTPDRARFLSLATAQEACRGLVANGVCEREALQLAERLVEVKTTGSRYRREYGPEGTGIVPEDKAIQVTWQMGVTGVHLVDLPVLFRGEWGVALETFTVAFNQALFDALYERVERFHRDYVVTKRPPPPDASDAYDDVLARMYPANRKPAVVASASDEDLMLRFAKFREVERRAKHFKKLAAQELKAIIGEADAITSATLGKVSWTRSKDKQKTDWLKAATEALALCGLCLNGYRRLREDEAVASEESIAELERRLKAIVPDATTVKPGHRSLRPYLTGDAAVELQQLNVMMDALAPGEESTAPAGMTADDVDE